MRQNQNKTKQNKTGPSYVREIAGAWKTQSGTLELLDHNSIGSQWYSRVTQLWVLINGQSHRQWPEFALQWTPYTWLHSYTLLVCLKYEESTKTPTEPSRRYCLRWAGECDIVKPNKHIYWHHFDFRKASRSKTLVACILPLSSSWLSLVNCQVRLTPLSLASI